MQILVIGDVIGKPGRKILSHWLPELRSSYRPDLIIINGENAAGGFGLTPNVADEIFNMGVHCITSGNHIWDKKEIYGYIAGESRLIRPANYPPMTPGAGIFTTEVKPFGKVAVINLIGRVFMGPADCPFRTIDAILADFPIDLKNIIIDMHGEATSEKIAMGHYLNGRVTAVIGTHSHVVTADETILSLGTAYITDIGMTGPVDSIIGIKKELILNKFLSSMPVKYEVASGKSVLRGVMVSVDQTTGKASQITRIERWSLEQAT